MKSMMLVGGLLGFLIGLAFALIQESEWPAVLWRASLGCCLAGLLIRWWGSVWVKCLKEVYTQRMAEAAQTKAAEAANKN